MKHKQDGILVPSNQADLNALIIFQANDKKIINLKQKPPRMNTNFEHNLYLDRSSLSLFYNIPVDTEADSPLEI